MKNMVCAFCQKQTEFDYTVNRHNCHSIRIRNYYTGKPEVETYCCNECYPELIQLLNRAE